MSSQKSQNKSQLYLPTSVHKSNNSSRTKSNRINRSAKDFTIQASDLTPVASSFSNHHYQHTLIPARQTQQLQIENLCQIMSTLFQREQRIQTFKEMLTEKSDFNPECLFSYLSQGHSHITVKNILQIVFVEILNDGNYDPEKDARSPSAMSVFQEYVRIVFASYGNKEKLNYSAFINFIFPVDIELLRYISSTGVRKYPIHTKVTEETLFTFACLIQEEVACIEEIERLKVDLFSKITRKQVKFLLRAIKESGDCKSQMQIESQNFIKYDELKNAAKKVLMKNEIKSVRPWHISEKNLPCIFRRLSIGKNNFINQQDLEFWVKPWNKTHCQQQHRNGAEKQSYVYFSCNNVSAFNK